ncbi:MAG TPA: hypothetical protein VKT82_29275 [Ktedonobacterales bacterium]|nr:hypothetical protein [Ktedonobacterales bacterium]
MDSHLTGAHLDPGAPHPVLAISQSPRSSFPGPLAAMLLGVVIVGAPLWLGLWAQNQLSAPTALPFSLLTVTPFTGGFEINSEARVLEARQYPIQYDLLYNDPTSPTFLGVLPSLRAANMGIIGGFISADLNHYECWRAWYALHKAEADWCSQSAASIYNTRGPNNLSTNPQNPHYATSLYKIVGEGLSTILSGNLDLQPLVQGFWVLDDQPGWETPGFAQPILQHIHAQIASAYAAFKLAAPPAICGFSGSIGNPTANPPTQDAFHVPLLQDYSPSGCDMVAFYNYAAGYSTKINPGGFDWGMTHLLACSDPSMCELAALHHVLQHYWPGTPFPPLVGIAQAFGGQDHTLKHSYYEIEPTAAELAQQSLAYCQMGARGLLFYAWDDSHFHDFPWNKENSLGQGVAQGVQACDNYW